MVKKGSIALRLFVFSLAWLIIALAFTAILLSNLYSQSLDNSLSETLDFHLETLVSEVLSNEGEKLPANSLSDPRFSRPASGYYWELRDENNNILDFSPSLVGSILPKINAKFDKNNRRTAIIEDGYGTKIRLIERQIDLDNKKISIIISGNLDELFAQVSKFRSQALIVLGAVGIMLAIMSAIVARFALRPIEKISTAIEDIREGKKEKISGQYPKEIAPLAEEINLLLQSNEQIINRAKSQVGNLAHGLKTPLAVLRNEARASKSDLAKIVESESEKMSNIVSTYLDRAQFSARTKIIGKKTDIDMVLNALIRVMNKIYPDCKIDYQPLQEKIWFRGEEGDLEEIIGNLLDNGCKWAKSKVKISLNKVNNKQSSFVRIIVEDDGKGLSKEQMKLAMERGVRLDEKSSGSGLGLDIVKELVDVYAGEIDLRQSSLGGLMVRVNLPALK